MDDDLNIKINYLLNFAIASDNFSKRDTYKNLINLLLKHADDEYSYGRSFAHKVKNDSNYSLLINNIYFDKTTYLIEKNRTFYTAKSKKNLDKKSLEHQEYKTLLTNMKNGHHLISVLNQLLIIKSVQDTLFDPNRDISFFSSFYGFYKLERNKIYIPIKSSVPLKNVRCTEKEKSDLIEIYEKYPCFFDLPENSSLENEILKNEKYLDTISSNFLKHCYGLKEQKEFEKYPLFNLKVAEFLIKNQEHNSILSKHLDVFNSRGHISIDDVSIEPQIFNFISLNISSAMDELKEPLNKIVSNKDNIVKTVA